MRCKSSRNAAVSDCSAPARSTAAIKRGWRMTRGHTLGDGWARLSAAAAVAERAVCAGGDMSATARMSQKELLATATLMRLTAQERQIEQGCGVSVCAARNA